MKLAGQICLALFMGAVVVAAGWVLFFFEGSGLLHQYRAQSFPKTEGSIISSWVTTSHGSKGGTSYHVHVSYRYEINGNEYRGSVYRYGRYPTDETRVDEIVRDNSAGTMVDVYYNPDDPKDALLAPQVIPQEVSQMFFFMTLFFVLISAFVRQLREVEWRGDNVPAGGVKILSRNFVTRVRLPRDRPIDMALSTALIISGIMALLVWLRVAVPASAGGIVGAVLIVIGAAVMFVWQFRKIVSGKQDLVINQDTRSVRLPMTYKRRQQLEISFAEIRAVVLEQVIHRTKSGTYYTYAPTLEMRDGSSEQLTDLGENRARSFAQWLQEKLGLAGPIIT